jgi:NADH-quinone oxidoreductase subunit J
VLLTTHVLLQEIASPPSEPQKVAEEMGYVEKIGHELFTRYLLPFEAISILILIAILGAVVLAKRKI